MKRAISLIAACMMLLLSINVNVFAANDGGDKYNEKLYGYAASLINVLDAGVSVSENGVDSDITRIELLKNTYKILNKGAKLEKLEKGELSLTDVDDDDKPYLEFAAYCGLINYKDKYFYPDKAADLQFAERTMLCLISYYNDNTVNQSLKNDLYKGLRKSASTSFKAGDAYVMIYNLLTSSYPYDVFYGTPIMQGLYNLEKAKVKLIGNELSSYSGYTPAAGRVKVEFSDSRIDDLSYSGDTKELLGRYVYMYYNPDEGDIAFMTPYRDDDIIAEFTEKEFESFDLKKRKIYWKELKSSNRWETAYAKKNKDISSTADIIYNGVFMSDQSRVYDILENNTETIDKIQLLSTEGASKVDLIKINSYTTAYVQTVASDKYVIRDKVSNSLITLDPNYDIGSIRVINTDGSPVGFTNIKTNSIISVFNIPSDEQSYEIRISTTTTDGTVTKIDRDENKRTITADGIEYSFASGLTAYADAMSTNTSYILHLDHNGFIAGYEYGALGADNVGGVISMVFNEINHSFRFKIYTISGETKEYTTRDKFRVNSAKATVNDNFTITVKNDKDDYENMSIVNFKRYLMKGLIQYKLDADENIRDIILPRKNAKVGSLGYAMGMNNPDMAINDPQYGKCRFKITTNHWFPDQYSGATMNFAVSNSNTKVIKIPAISFESDREKYFSLGSTSEFRNDYTAAILAYTFGGERAVTADIIAIIQDTSSDPKESSYYVVKKILSAENKEENVGKLIQCINAQTGVEEEFTTESEKFAEYSLESQQLTGNDVEIDKGDIIQIGVNGYGDAAAFVKIYDCSEGKVKPVNADAWYAEKRIVKGSVYSVTDTHFTYIDGSEINEEAMEINKYTQIGHCNSVITVEKDADKDDYDIKSGKPNELIGYIEDPENYSRVIYITRYGDTRACIEYK